MAIEAWEVRRALRYGSKHVTTYYSLAEAEAHAKRDIEQRGNVGRIDHISPNNVGGGGTLYYDVYEEDS